MSAKVKITKREIKEDKFTTSMILARDWLLEKWQITAIIAAIIVVVIIGIVFVSSMQKDKAVEGNNRLNMAIAKMKNLNYQEAILDFGSILDDFGGNLAARAQFYLANAHYDSRNYDEALNNYKIYFDKYHADKLSTASALGGIAACMENKQDFVAAGDKYLEAIDYYPQSASAPDYYLGAVRCFVLGNNLERAGQAHTAMKEKFPNNEYLRVASRLLAGLKVN